jgi:adenylate kinase family enzyme
MKPFPYRRVVVIGPTGSGKSTLAERIAQKLGCAFIELDALHWEPNWVEVPDEVFRERVKVATSSPSWTVAGNYDVVRDIVWPHADAVIWLDYSFPIVFTRLFRRTIRRSVMQEKIFSGNVENFGMHLKLWSEESIFNWLFKSYPRLKRKYPVLLSQPENAHLKLIHLRRPKDTDQWLEELTAA